MNKTLRSLLLLLPLTCAPALTAQEADPAPAARRPAVDPVLVSLTFRGGSMADFVAAVREGQPKANIVLAARAADAVVPPMVLKQAGIEQALEGAATAAEGDAEVRVREHKGAGEPVYSIVAYTRPQQQTTAMGATRDPAALTQRVFALNDLTGEQPLGVPGFTVETILGALKLATDSEQNPPRIRYHEDSGLLLVRGTNAQAELVEMTLITMQRDLQGRQNRAAQLEAERRRKDAEAAKDR